MRAKLGEKSITKGKEKTLNSHSANYVMSGEKCPANGLWENIEPLKTTVILQKDQTMPKYSNAKVIWRLLHQDL